jgi:hypothetical protein
MLCKINLQITLQEHTKATQNAGLVKIYNNLKFRNNIPQMTEVQTSSPVVLRFVSVEILATGVKRAEIRDLAPQLQCPTASSLERRLRPR